MPQLKAAGRPRKYSASNCSGGISHHPERRCADHPRLPPPIGRGRQAEAEQLAADLGVSTVGRSKGKRIVIGRDYVEEQLVVAGLSFRYRQPEGAFTQPNGEVCQKMLNWAYEALGERDDDLLELYCGNGNFTLPLATRVRRVLATEISKTSVNAALANIEDNGLDNIELVRLSAEELTQALNEVRPFRRRPGST